MVFEDFYFSFMIALGTESGPILSPFWDLKSDQIGPKRVKKSIKKVIGKLVEFGINFWAIFGQFWLPTWGARGSNQSGVRGQVGSRSHLGAQMAPRPPPSSIFGRSWSILGRFWYDSGSIFVWLLMDNVNNLTNLTILTNLTNLATLTTLQLNPRHGGGVGP